MIFFFNPIDEIVVGSESWTLPIRFLVFSSVGYGFSEDVLKEMLRVLWIIN